MPPALLVAPAPLVAAPVVAPPPPELVPVPDPVCAAPDAVDGLLADRPGTAVVMSGVPRPLSEGTLVVAPLMLLPPQGWAESVPGAGPLLDVLGLTFVPGLFKPAPGRAGPGAI